VLQRIEAIVGARAFGLPPGQRARVARVIFQVFKGLLSLVLSSQGRERAALVRELKTVLRRYLEPIDRVDRRR